MEIYREYNSTVAHDNTNRNILVRVFVSAS
ncbi:hypothetical protein GDO81_008040 [Engystomops pustulosus]|uniref:Uncharacterized protein n=1 Tax=Engystomops pustulosus TaxID=76066 RepID=A0AAV7CBN4_ENGPU|nr:hypothetical protein GDO81_008040 [Engystomops pustulosus]